MAFRSQIECSECGHENEYIVEGRISADSVLCSKCSHSMTVVHIEDNVMIFEPRHVDMPDIAAARSLVRDILVYALESLDTQRELRAAAHEFARLHDLLTEADESDDSLHTRTVVAMNDAEATSFAASKLKFGKYSGRTYSDVPIDYLTYLADMQLPLFKYLLSAEGRRRIELDSD